MAEAQPRSMTSEEFSRYVTGVWRKFVANASPDDIHRSLLTVNWDDDDFDHPLWTRILSDPKVDRATALAAYWRSGPRWHRQYSPEEARQTTAGRLCEEIEQRYLTGFWTNGDIFYDPACDDEDDWTADYAEVTTVRDIPEVMFEPVSGDRWVPRPEEEWDEGLPLGDAAAIFDVEIRD